MVRELGGTKAVVPLCYGGAMTSALCALLMLAVPAQEPDTQQPAAGKPIKKIYLAPMPNGLQHWLKKEFYRWEAVELVASAAEAEEILVFGTAEEMRDLLQVKEQGVVLDEFQLRRKLLRNHLGRWNDEPVFRLLRGDSGAEIWKTRLLRDLLEDTPERLAKAVFQRFRKHHESQPQAIP